MTKDKDYLLLKWGTLKGWKIKTESARAAFQHYADTGKHSLSAAMQYDDDDQKKALCDLIDAIDGKIQNDWSGKYMTKDEAKRYVIEYGSD